MSIAPSLKSRVKRLEDAAAVAHRPGIAEVLRACREHRHAMTPLAAALSHVELVERRLAALKEPTAPLDNGWLGMRYRAGQGHLIDMAELDAPDAAPLTPAEAQAGNSKAYYAWSAQQGRRQNARKYLDALAFIAAADPNEVAAVRAAEAAWSASLHGQRRGI